jgi:ABC-type Fe3+-siderophore transport system permease subunit
VVSLTGLIGFVALFRWLQTEPPVGAVTALVGGPLFLVILLRGRRHAFG